MGMMQRRKGKTGEREVANILRDLLGVVVRRNLEQARDGGGDLLGLPGWLPEVKRAARPSLPAWWTQTLDQAALADSRPVLIYRIDRHDWRVRVAIADVIPGFDRHTREIAFTVEMDLIAFAALVRENIVSEEIEHAA